MIYKRILEELSCRNCGGTLRREHMPEKDEGYGYECTTCKMTYSPIEIIDLFEIQAKDNRGRAYIEQRRNKMKEISGKEYVKVEIISGVAGECIAINDTRVWGSEPYGGGTVKRRMCISKSKLREALKGIHNFEEPPIYE